MENITFDDSDFQGVMLPHSDPLVIILRIENFNVKRVMVANGSSENIILASAVRQMRLAHEIVPRKTAGSNGQTLGDIELTTLAEGVQLKTRFKVVDTDLAYNVILGCPWIHGMRAIASTVHQVVKFPTPWGIRGIRGDQLVARKCYEMELRLAEEEARNAEQLSCTLEFDGASKGNPGPAGAGAVLRATDGSVVSRLREGVGFDTNNVAEYRGLILGLRYALKKGFKHIRVQGDSQLVCMQTRGIWKCSDQKMAELSKIVKELKDQFMSFQINHVARELNGEADAQANLAVSLKNGDIRMEGDTM